jgi:hypothetical protein
VFLARAAYEALYAAQSATRGWGRRRAYLRRRRKRVFFGKAAPDVLLEVLLEAPLPTEYDPVFSAPLSGGGRVFSGGPLGADWGRP